MTCSICLASARGEQEYAYTGGLLWDITKAKQIAKESQNIVQLSPEQVRTEALSPPGREGYTVISGFENFIDEKHFSHIEDPAEPVIVGSFPSRSSRDKSRVHIVIDGHHRMVLAAREGRCVIAYVLNAAESRLCILPKHKAKEIADRSRVRGSHAGR